MSLKIYEGKYIIEGIIREVSDYSGISMSYSYKDSIPFYIESKNKTKK